MNGLKSLGSIIIISLFTTPLSAQKSLLQREVKYIEINESDQSFLEHQDAHARKLESLDINKLTKNAAEVLHIDSIRIGKRDVRVTFEDAWFMESDYFDRGARHSEWLYNMDVKGVADSLKIFVGHYECHQQEAEYQAQKFPHLYEDVEDFMKKRNRFLIGNSITKFIARQMGSFQGQAILHDNYVAHESITNVEKKFLAKKSTRYLECIIIYLLDGEHVIISVYKGKDQEPEYIKIDSEHVFQRHHFASREVTD